MPAIKGAAALVPLKLLLHLFLLSVVTWCVCVCMYVCVCACMYHRHKYVWAEYSVVRCIEVTGFCTNKDWYVETKPSSLGV